MSSFDSVIKIAAPSPRNMPRLKQDAAAIFSARYVDCNETDGGANVAVYLSGEQQPGDQTTFANLVAAHDPVQLSADQAIEKRRRQAEADYGALTQLADKTDAQIASFVNANVTDFNSAKAAIKFLARAIGALARRGDIED